MQGAHPSEIQILEDIPGIGVAVVKGALVFCHFTGYLEDGTKFDSSYDHGRPFECVVGSKKVIAGWSQGLMGMKEGGRRKFFVPAALAYGERQIGAFIKPNSNLIYEVEVIEVRPREA
jgi:FKBP-type peptidyl-prolyl cis-trans isomerase